LALSALANYTFTQNLNAVLAQAAVKLKMNVTGLVLSMKQSTLSAGYASLAALANRHHKKIVSRLSSLQRLEDEVTVAANTNSAAIPATLLRLRLIEVQFVLANDVRNTLPIRVIGQQEVWNLTPTWRNGELTRDCPVYASLNGTNETVEFYPYLSTSRTFNLIFQQSMTPWTGSDVISTSSTNYSAIPDDYDDLLPLFIAEEIARNMKMRELNKDIAEFLHGPKQNDVTGRFREVSNEISDLPARSYRASYTYSNEPQPALCNDPTEGVYFGNSPGRRGN